MESHFVALELLDTEINVLFVNTLSVDTLWNMEAPNFLTELQTFFGQDPDPVFLFTGLSTFGEEEKFGCGGLPYVAYWASYIDAKLTRNSAANLFSGSQEFR